MAIKTAHLSHLHSYFEAALASRETRRIGGVLAYACQHVRSSKLWEIVGPLEIFLLCQLASILHSRSSARFAWLYVVQQSFFLN